MSIIDDVGSGLKGAVSAVGSYIGPLGNVAALLVNAGVDELRWQLSGKHIINYADTSIKRLDVKRTGWAIPSLIPDDKGRPIPIVYGAAYVNAAIVGIDNAEYLSAGKGGYVKAGVLIALCYGKAIGWFGRTVNSSNIITKVGDYTTSGGKMIPPWPSTETPLFGITYNDGTQATEIPLVKTNGAAVPYKSALPGVAWYYIPKNWFLNFFGGLENNQAWPRLEVLVLRRLTSPLVNTEISAMELQDDVLHKTGYSTNPHSYGDNPAAIAYDLLTNTSYGLGISTSLIDLTSFNIASQYFYDKRYGLNFQIDQATKAEEIFSMLSAAVDLIIRIDNNGNFSALVLDPALGGNTQMTFTDDDMQGFSMGSVSWESTYNFFSAKCLKAGPIGMWGTYDLSMRSPFNAAMQGAEKKFDLDLTMFSVPSIAEERLSVLAKRLSTPTTGISFSTSLQAMRLLVGDLIRVENTEFGISGTFRILNKDIPSPESNTITLVCEQASETIFDQNTYTGSGGAPEDTVTQATEVGAFETLAFAGFSNVSADFSAPFTDPTKVRVRWSLGQAAAGELLLGTDFTVVAQHIELDPTIFADDIQANTLGLMSVDVWEIT